MSNNFKLQLVAHTLSHVILSERSESKDLRTEILRSTNGNA